MKSTKIKICDTIIHPGEVANLALPLPEQYSCSPLYMPIKVINGHADGPCLVIFSVLKGKELNGLEIANRISNQLSPELVSGSVITVPVVNVYGLTHYPTTLPIGNNLANCFPGNENGTFGERIAHLF
ncbi:MAG: succinylglutamate desuccinylase/aspartoacylase family protein, partial [Verrucomicrobia bacterium]|nr:succinylglutamate desuccinylase/aspartoacylase family protein [Verrucomicrobiota bacterium]